MNKKLTLLYGVMIVMLSMTSCESLETEYGNSLLFFSNSDPRLELLDTQHAEEQLLSLPDSVVLLTDVYRSGISENMDEITVDLQIDQKYIEDIIATAQATPEEALTDQMKSYRYSKALPENMASVPAKITIPAGKRSVNVPITLKMGALKRFDNGYFNYSYSEFTSPIAKDKMMVLCLVLKGTNTLKLAEENVYCLVGITKCLINL